MTRLKYIYLEMQYWICPSCFKSPALSKVKKGKFSLRLRCIKEESLLKSLSSVFFDFILVSAHHCFQKGHVCPQWKHLNCFIDIWVHDTMKIRTFGIVTFTIHEKWLSVHNALSSKSRWTSPNTCLSQFLIHYTRYRVWVLVFNLSNKCENKQTVLGTSTDL